MKIQARDSQIKIFEISNPFNYALLL